MQRVFIRKIQCGSTNIVRREISDFLGEIMTPPLHGHLWCPRDKSCHSFFVSEDSLSPPLMHIHTIAHLVWETSIILIDFVSIWLIHCDKFYQDLSSFILTERSWSVLQNDWSIGNKRILRMSWRSLHVSWIDALNAKKKRNCCECLIFFQRGDLSLVDDLGADEPRRRVPLQTHHLVGAGEKDEHKRGRSEKPYILS